MKTKIKRHSRSVISVLLAVCMLVSCMTAGMIMTDAAKVGDAVGEWGNNKGNYFCVKIGSNTTWTPIDGSTESAEIDLSSYSDGDTVSFDLYATEYNGATPEYFNKSANISATQGSSYTFQKGGSSGSSRNTFTVADKGKIKVKGSWENGSLKLTVSSASGNSAAGSPKTYYYKGDTEGWNGIEMAETSSGVYSTAVTFTADSQKFKFYESSKDKWYGHGSSGYPISTSAWGSQLNEGGQNIKAPGTGRYILYFRPSDKKAYAEAAPVKSTLSIEANIPGADVTATYDGATKVEGESFTNVPAGAQVTINVTPDTAGQVCTAITTTPEGIVSNSGGTWKLTMPEQNASINSVTVGDAAPRTVYFNNYVSQWSKVYVYTKKADGTDGNGAAPGREMTQVGTSSVYSAEIPGDTIYIVFSGSGGSTNEGSTHITYKTNTNFGNSLPSDYNEYKATAANGSTGEWSAHSDRNNVYTVTAGETLTNNNDKLYYNGINATLYDYYTDNEYNYNNSSSANWINGINSTTERYDYSHPNGKKFKWNPYKTLDKALSKYAFDNNVPYPLYFGNLNMKDQGGGNSEGNLNRVGGNNTSEYTNWYYKINNSTNLKPDGASITELAANTEGNSTINHNGGAAMAMFDEDWLSQENETGKPLATILHSSAFPVRKITANVYTEIYWDCSNIDWYYNEGVTTAYAHFWKSSDPSQSTNVAASSVNNKVFKFEVPNGYDRVLFYRAASIDGTWKNKTNDLTIDNALYKNISTSGETLSGSWQSKDGVTPVSSYTYYEYNSTNGIDNAYIRNVNTGDKKATIEYYDGSNDSNKVYSSGMYNSSGHREGQQPGFFPFDKMTGNITNDNSGSAKYAHDLGFGMKLEIPFSLNDHGTVDGTADGIAQTFNFSGDDDLWVYIDGHLVLDLGGAHKKAEGSINFKDKRATSTTKIVKASNATNNDATDLTASETYSNSFASATWFNSNPEALHTMTIYYMERGMYDSNLKFDFSFHAIQNLYTTEKKIRTRNINSGFYVKDATTRDDDTGMTKFEASYQYEHFNVEHKVSSDNTTYANPANKFNYARVEITPTPNGDTKVTHTEQHAANADLVYNLTNDDRAQFNGKFTSGDYFQLTERPAEGNKYSYTPTLRVFDDNDKTGATKFDVPIRDDGTFRFQFGEQDDTGLKTVNVRGQLENEMKQHDLTIKKDIGDKTDTDTEFVFRITFNFDYEGSGVADNGYEGYPLYISSDKDPSKTQLDSFSIGGSSALSMGYFKIKAGETITIPKIPEGAKFQIEEILGGITEYHADPITNYSYGGMAADVADATPVPGKNAVTMTMGTSPVVVTATNVFADNFTISKKILDDMDSTETYNIIINTKANFEVGALATAYKGPYVIKHADGSADTSEPYDDTRTECKVTLHPNDEIKIGVVTETYFEITEEALSSDYKRMFHYVSSTVDGTTFNKASSPTDDVKVVDNGVLVKVTSENKRVDINNKAWGYMIEYTYPGYLKRYGVYPNNNQKYYVSGLFSEADYEDKVELAEVADNSNGNVTGNVTVQGVKFKNDEIQKNFITSHAPYENNFMTNLVWNPIFEGETGSNTNRFFYAKNTGEEVNMKTNAVVTENKECQVYFRFPFAFTSSNAGLVPTPSQDDDGKILKTDVQQKNVQTPYGKWYTLNNKYTEAEAKFVSAPREIYQKNSNGTYDKYVFRYWSMQTTKSGKNGDNTHALRTTEEYKRCYYWDFNMTFYQDTIVEPVYALASSVDTNLTPAQLETLDTTNGGGTNITFLENSRNQWNRNGGNNQEIPSREKQGDRVYSDFLLSFSWNDIMLRTALSKKITEIVGEGEQAEEVTSFVPYLVNDDELHYSGGLVIEKVAAAPAITSTNDIKTQDEYRALYGDGDDLVTAATDFINSGKTNDGNFLLNETFSAAGFDNKNQFEYSTSFANKSHSDLRPREYKSYVYRAYTYLRDYDGSTATTGNCMVNGSAASADEVNKIKTHNGELLKVSKPVYFTIYEMATIENGTTYTGQGES